jgi:hypothetical protein
MSEFVPPDAERLGPDLDNFFSGYGDVILNGSISITVNAPTYDTLQSEANWLLDGGAALSWGSPWAEFPPPAAARRAGIAMAGMGILIDLLLKTNAIHK